MEKSAKNKSADAGCKITACLECALCRAVNFEEKRTARFDIRNEARALYGAEILFYYFYYQALPNRA